MDNKRNLEKHLGYAVDALGNVWCRRPINGKGRLSDIFRIVRPLLCSNGRYYQVGIEKKKYLVHRLVAEAFYGPCPEGKEVSHLNGNSKDNRAVNLSYVTHGDNEAQKNLHKTKASGERNGMAKLTAKQVSNIRKRTLKNKRGAVTSLAKEFGVSPSIISMIKNGKRWQGEEEI